MWGIPEVMGARDVEKTAKVVNKRLETLSSGLTFLLVTFKSHKFPATQSSAASSQQPAPPALGLLAPSSPRQCPSQEAQGLLVLGPGHWRGERRPRLSIGRGCCCRETKCWASAPWAEMGSPQRSQLSKAPGIGVLQAFKCPGL